MKLGVKLTHPNAKMPCYAHPTDSGMDIRSVEDKYIPSFSTVRVETGVAFDTPDGYELQVRPRSGMAGEGIVCQFGTIDSGYRDSLKIIISNTTNESYQIKAGDRIAQIILSPVIQAELFEVKELSKTKRGINGHGSTGVR
jgi:dUTP pyrophosphatase